MEAFPWEVACKGVSAAFKGRMKKYRMNLFGELRDAND